MQIGIDKHSDHKTRKARKCLAEVLKEDYVEIESSGESSVRIEEPEEGYGINNGEPTKDLAKDARKYIKPMAEENNTKSNTTLKSLWQEYQNMINTQKNNMDSKQEAKTGDAGLHSFEPLYSTTNNKKITEIEKPNNDRLLTVQKFIPGGYKNEYGTGRRN